MHEDTAVADRAVKAWKDMGISQRKLTELTGISQSTLSRIENGREPTPVELAVIANATGVTVAELLGGHRLEAEVQCAARVDDEDGFRAMYEPMLRFFYLADRLEGLGVSRPA